MMNISPKWRQVLTSDGRTVNIRPGAQVFYSAQSQLVELDAEPPDPAKLAEVKRLQAVIAEAQAKLDAPELAATIEAGVEAGMTDMGFVRKAEV